MNRANDKLAQGDTRDLQRLGYAQELFRTVGGFSNFAISFFIISIITCVATQYACGLANGGPAEMSFGWPLVQLFTLALAASMAELAPAFPTLLGLNSTPQSLLIVYAWILISYGVLRLLMAQWTLVGYPGIWVTRGPWNLGRYASSVNVVAIAWTVFICLILVMPPPNQLAGQALLGIMVLLTAWYLTIERRRLKGEPVLQTGAAADV